VGADDGLHRLPAHGQKIQPEQHRPESILLPHVVGARSETLLPAEGDPPGVQKVAEVLPTGGGLVGRDSEPFGHPVDCGAGGHRAGHPAQPRPVSGQEVGVGRQHREAVARGDEEAPPQDHVAVAVAVRGRPEVGGARPAHGPHQLRGVDEVGVGVPAAEVLPGNAVQHAAGRRAEAPLEDLRRVGSGDRVHRVEEDRQGARAERGADPVEVEQRLHQPGVGRHRVDDLHGEVADLRVPEAPQVHLWRIRDPVVADRLGAPIEGLGVLLGGGPAVLDVVLDPEIPVGAARVVACGEDDPAEGLALADFRGSSGRGKDPAPPDDEASHAVGGRQPDDGLDRLAVEVSPVPAQHQGLAPQPLERVEDRLDEVLEIMGLAEDLDLLAQARRARALPRKGPGRHRADVHGVPPVRRPPRQGLL